MENTEIKSAIDGLNKAWVEFKSENDKGRSADKAVLEKINTDLDRLGKGVEDFAAEKKARADAQAEIEKKLNRLLIGSPGSEQAQAASERKVAFERWARVGDEGIGYAEVKAMRERKVLSVSDDVAGGYLASPEYTKEIIKAEVLYSPMRTLVRVRSTGSKSAHLRVRTSPAAATWVAELATRAETTNPAYGLKEVPAHEMYAEVDVTTAELEDSDFDLEAEFTQEFAEQFAVSEGAAVISGNGVGKPAGIVDAGSPVITGSKFVASGNAATISSAGVLGAFYALPSPYVVNSKWLFNRTTLGAIRQLKDSQNRYLWEPSIAAGNPSTLLGTGYVECPDMPSEGANTYPIAVGDWRRAYTLVDRLAISMTRDPYTKANVGQVKFFARKRVGGMVVLADAVRLVKCST